MKKEMLNKLKALLLAGTVSTTLSGCTLNITYDKENHSLNITTDDEEAEKTIDNIINSLEKNEETTTETATTTTSEAINETTVATNPTTTTTPYIAPPIVDTTFVTSETTTVTTEPIITEEQEIDFMKTAMDSWIIDPQFEVKDEMYEIKLDEENPTLWQIASKYHPSDKNILEFLEEIKEINNINEDSMIKKGDAIKVPVRIIYYIGNSTMRIITYYTDTPIEEIYRLNNLPHEEGTEYEYKTVEEKLIARILPQNTTSYKRQDGKTTHIIGNTILFNDEFLPLTKTYDKESYTAGLEIIRNGSYLDACHLIQIQEDGTFYRHFVAMNPEKVYLIDDIPVIETRNFTTCYAYELSEEKDYIYFTTAATTRNPEIYHFYKDKDGNVCFTFDATDLTKYGYTKADELASEYIKYPEAYIQDTEHYDEPSKTK